MAYASLTDLEQRLGSTVYVQLTDDAGTGAADSDVANEAMQGAEGEANSYLGLRYAVPVALSGEEQLAAVLKSVTLDLAEYRLHARRPTMPEGVRQRREAAVRWLQLVAGGQAVLPSSRELADNPALGMTGEVVGSPRVLTRKEMKRL